MVSWTPVKDSVPAADLLDRARALASRYDGPPVPAWLMAAAHRGDPHADPLFAPGEPHDPRRFHPMAVKEAVGWDVTHRDAPAVWLGLNLGDELECPRWVYDDPDKPFPTAVFPPPAGSAPADETAWSFVGVHARCPADGETAARWFTNMEGLVPRPTLTPAEYDRRHDAAAALCRDVRDLASAAGPLLAAVRSETFPLPMMVGCGAGRYRSDPVTLFLLAAFGVAEQADPQSRGFSFKEAWTGDDAPPVRRRLSGYLGPADPPDGLIRSGWTPWHWVRVGDLAAAVVLAAEWLTTVTTRSGTSGPVPPAATADAPAKGVSTVWPPDDGWHFLGGKAAFRGVAVNLPSSELGILEALSGGVAKDLDQLSEAATGDFAASLEPKTISSYVSRLNGKLAEAFEVPAGKKPVTGSGSVRRRVYLLDDGLLSPPGG